MQVTNGISINKNMTFHKAGINKLCLKQTNNNKKKNAENIKIVVSVQLYRKQNTNSKILQTDIILFKKKCIT